MDFVLELVAVFLAVTLAFWAEDLREARSDRSLGRSYLEGIGEDLRKDVESLQKLITVHRGMRDAARTTLEYFEGKAIEVDPFLETFWAVFNWESFKPNRNAFQEVVSTGGLRLIRNASLRRKLLDLYARYESLEALEQHIYKDYNEYMVDPMVRKLTLRLPGPWSDDPRYEEEVRALTSDFLLQNGLRAHALQLDQWLLPMLESLRDEVVALGAEVDEALAN